MKYRPTKKVWLVSGLTCLVALLVLGALELTDTTHLFHASKKTVYTAGQSTKGEATGSATKGGESGSQQTDTDGSQPGDTKSASGGDSQATLLAPSGNFVSAHHVSSSTGLSSVCNTTPAATCSIYFTQGATTKNLPIQSADRGGSTYWDNWTPASIGLSSGTWDITAKSSLNGKSLSADDAMKLVVQ